MSPLSASSGTDVGSVLAFEELLTVARASYWLQKAIDLLDPSQDGEEKDLTTLVCHSAVAALNAALEVETSTPEDLRRIAKQIYQEEGVILADLIGADFTDKAPNVESGDVPVA